MHLRLEHVAMKATSTLTITRLATWKHGWAFQSCRKDWTLATYQWQIISNNASTHLMSWTKQPSRLTAVYGTSQKRYLCVNLTGDPLNMIYPKNICHVGAYDGQCVPLISQKMQRQLACRMQMCSCKGNLLILGRAWYGDSNIYR